MEDKSRFTLEDWNAPVYIGAEELRHALVHMELENKAVSDFWTIRRSNFPNGTRPRKK